MDNLTHGLVGALIGQAGLKTKTGLGMPALIIGANLPDVDAACFFWLEGTEHLGFRRGITHGPIAWLVLPVILAGLLWGWDRWQQRRGKRPEGRLPVHFGWLYGLSLIGCLTHPALDWLNVYGIRLLEPFSSQWFYGDTLFIIDLWLWALLIGSIWWSRRSEKRGGEWRRFAKAGLVVALGYIALNGAITGFDYRVGGGAREPYSAEYISAPAPLAFWQREEIAQLPNGRWISSAFDGAEFGYGYRQTAKAQCVFPNLAEERARNSQLDSFLFWSRAPFAERAEDGSIILRDARFYDPRARNRFSVALPDIACEELPNG
ncbi:MAG: metal-dependent hydrolase [Erythrobacter sp.]|nr:metal-dependent hydrolase [Erythrobacter sp.]